MSILQSWNRYSNTTSSSSSSALHSRDARSSNLFDAYTGDRNSRPGTHPHHRPVDPSHRPNGKIQGGINGAAPPPSSASIYSSSGSGVAEGGGGGGRSNGYPSHAYPNGGTTFGSSSSSSNQGASGMSGSSAGEMGGYRPATPNSRYESSLLFSYRSFTGGELIYGSAIWRLQFQLHLFLDVARLCISYNRNQKIRSDFISPTDFITLSFFQRSPLYRACTS